MIHGIAAICGADCTADPGGHAFTHAENGEGGGYHTEYYKKSNKNGRTSGRVWNPVGGRSTGLDGDRQ